MYKPLKNVRILDLSQAWAGPIASMMLADYGGEVIKIEPPVVGDHSRSWASSKTKGQSPHYLAVNRNKESIIIDLKTEIGRELFNELALKSDIILENFRPGVTKKLGIDYEEIKNVNSEIIYCSISGYGQKGPYYNRAAYDSIIQGEGGAMGATGEMNGPPIKLAGHQADVLAAVSAAFTIMVSYLTKLQTGKGTYLDLSLLDMQVLLMSSHIINYNLSGEIPKRLGNAHPLMVPSQNIRTKDIDITISVVTDRSWEGLWKVLGKSEMIDDRRFLTNDDRAKNRELIITYIEEVTLTQVADYWVQKFSENNVPAGVINTIDRVASHKQVEYRKMMRKVVHTELGEILLPGIPWKIDGIDDEDIKLPPSHGQHTEYVLQRVLNKTAEDILELKKQQIITSK